MTATSKPRSSGRWPALGCHRPRHSTASDSGGTKYRIDLAYPDRWLAIEIDSWAYHRWRSSFDGDRAKRNDLTLAGYTVLQVTDGMSDAEIVTVVARALSTLGRSADP